jgi:hypothetical protein
MTAMVDANYSGVGTANLSALTTANTGITFNLSGTGTTPQAASAFRIWTKQAGSILDCDFVNVSIFR